MTKTRQTPKVRGFQIEIDQTDYAAYRDVRRYEWDVNDYYIGTRAEFGASPIRDKKSMDEYLRRIASHDLQFTVYAIT